MNDNIIPFRRRSKRNEPRITHVPTPAKIGVPDPFRESFDMHTEMADNYRFFVMEEGLPKDTKNLYDLTKRLQDALGGLVLEYGPLALCNLGGVYVFFSRETSEMHDDPGFRSLQLNNGFSVKDIERLLRPVLRSQSIKLS